ncbi:O-antigen ligase family protein [Bradyrhizobium sp. USDA 4486]
MTAGPDAQINSRPEMRAKASMPQSFAYFAALLLCTIVALAPLPFGSVSIGAIAVEVIGLSVVLACASCRELVARDRKIIAGFALFAGCWAAVVTIQLLPSGGERFGLSNPAWREASRLLEMQLPDYVTAVRHQPLLSAGSQIACATALLSGYLVGRDASSAALVFRVFAISGLIYAVFGIVMAFFAPHCVLWLEKAAYRDVLTGTFINANTAAIYFGACSLAWFLLMTDDVKRYSNLRAVLVYLPRQTVACLTAFLVTLSATFMTGSRAGSGLALLVISTAAAVTYRHHVKTWFAMGAGLLWGIGIFAGTVVLLGGRVSDRFDTSGFTDEGRLSSYASTLKILHDYPWLGTGLGTFVWVFPSYRSDSAPIVGVWDRAHNTALEIASEMGIPFLVMVALAWLAIFTVLFMGMVKRKRDRIFPIFAFWTGCLTILHCQIDFSLQIPGLSIPILSLIGVGLSQSAPSGHWRRMCPPLDSRMKRQ